MSILKVTLTQREREQIAEILNRRANEVASFADAYRQDPKHHGSIEMGLSREVKRLRHLAERVNPPIPDEEE